MTRRRQAQTFVARVASGFPLHSRLRICCVRASAFQQQQYEGTAVEVLYPSALHLMLDAHDPTGCCSRPAGRGGWARAPGGYAVRFVLNEIGTCFPSSSFSNSRIDLVPRESSHTRSKLLYPMTLTLRSRSRYQRSNRLWHYTNAVLHPDWVKTVFGAI
ncbi:hypothetical protein EDB83DRAFT_2446153, partial [Lactarius deliciosus]